MPTRLGRKRCWDKWRRGKKLGLDEALVRKVFRGQMEAGKLIQEDALGRWKAEKAGQFEQVVELPKLREQFDRASEDLLKALAEALPELEKITDMKELLGLAEPVFRQSSYDENIIRMALEPLVNAP